MQNVNRASGGAGWTNPLSANNAPQSKTLATDQKISQLGALKDQMQTLEASLGKVNRLESALSSHKATHLSESRLQEISSEAKTIKKDVMDNIAVTALKIKRLEREIRADKPMDKAHEMPPFLRKPLPPIPERSQTGFNVPNRPLPKPPTAAPTRPPVPNRPLPPTPQRAASSSAPAAPASSPPVSASQRPAASSAPAAMEGANQREGSRLLRALRQIKNAFSSRSQAPDISTKFQNDPKTADGLGERLFDFQKKTRWLNEGKSLIESRMNTIERSNDPQKIEQLKGEIKEIQAFIKSKPKLHVDSETKIPEYTNDPAKKAATPQEAYNSIQSLSEQIGKLADNGETVYTPDKSRPNVNNSFEMLFRNTVNDSALLGKAESFNPDIKNVVTNTLNREALVILKDSSQNVSEALNDLEPSLDVLRDFTNNPKIELQSGELKDSKELAESIVKDLKETHTYGESLEKGTLSESENKLQERKKFTVAQSKNNANSLLYELSKAASKKLATPEAEALTKDIRAALEKHGGDKATDITGKGYKEEIAPLVNQLAALVNQSSS